MAALRQKVILLTGAPASASFTEDSCTLQTFEASFIRLFNLEQHISDDTNIPQDYTHAPWRSLPLNVKPLHTGLGFSQAHYYFNDTFHDNEFFTTAELSLCEAESSSDSQSEENQDLLTQFCEQSLAIHNSLATTPPVQEQETATTTSFNDISFISTSTASISSYQLPSISNIPAHLSDLEDIPPAHQVTSLQPQTITLNLIVGILSIAQPRAVTTRWGQSMSLIEVLVGDNTKTAFSVTFWISTDTLQQSSIAALRRQDVVLMQNVALHVFRGKVYGQSLRRNMTKLDLLWRRDGSGHYTVRDLRKLATAPVEQRSQLQKITDVVDWVIRFVGSAAPEGVRGGKSNVGYWKKPPLDTQ